MPAKRRRRSSSAQELYSLEAIEIRKLMVMKEIKELLAEVINCCNQLGIGGIPFLGNGQTVTHTPSPFPSQTPIQATAPMANVSPEMPRVTTSPTGCQICGNPYAVFTEVRPGLSQYLCQIHARERALQRAGDAKAAAAGFSTDRTDARPQNIRLPEDNQRAKILIHPTATDMAAVQQHAKEHPDVPDHVEFDETPEEA